MKIGKLQLPFLDATVKTSDVIAAASETIHTIPTTSTNAKRLAEYLYPMRVPSLFPISGTFFIFALIFCLDIIEFGIIWASFTLSV